MTVEGDAAPSPQDMQELFASTAQSEPAKQSTIKSAAVGAAASAAPAAGGLAGLETGLEVGSYVGPVGAVVGAVVGGLAGSAAAEWGQNKILPDSVKQEISQAHEDNKIAFDVGSIAANAAAFKVQPGTVIEGGADIIGGRFGTKAAKIAAAQIGIGAGVAVAAPLIQGQKPDTESLVMGVLQAALLGEPRFKLKWGKAAPAAAQAKAEDMAKNLTPEQKAHIEAVAKTGLDPKDHEVLQEAIGDKKNVRLFTPDQEAAQTEKPTPEDKDAVADAEVEKLLKGEVEPPAEEGAPSENEGAKPEPPDKITGEILQQMHDAGLTTKQIAQIKTPMQAQRAIEMRKSIAKIDQAAADTEQETKAAAAAAPAPEPPQDPLHPILGKIENAKTPAEVADHMDSPEAKKLSEPDYQKLIEGARQKSMDLISAARRAEEQKYIESKVDDQPFSTTHASDEYEDHLTHAARSGRVVATTDRRTGQIIVFPRGLSNRIGMMRDAGYSDPIIKQNIKSLLAHEEIHSATPEGFAEEYWNQLSRPEKWAHRQLYPSGTSRTDTYMGGEAFRMRMQEVMGMTPDDISEAAGSLRLKLDTIYALQKGARVVRETFLNRNVRGRAMAMVKEAELKLNLAEDVAISKASGVQASETRAKDFGNPNERLAAEQENAAKEYLAQGDQETHDELMARALWLRQRGDQADARKNFNPNSETRGGDLFSWKKAQSEKEETRGAPKGKRQIKRELQQELIPTRDTTQTAPRPMEGAMGKFEEMRLRQESVAKGDFTKATEADLMPAPSAFQFQGMVENEAARIIDDRIANPGNSRPLDRIYGELQRRFSNMAGVQPGHVQQLVAEAFWKKLLTLRGAEVDALLNSSLKESAKEKGVEFRSTAEPTLQREDLASKNITLADLIHANLPKAAKAELSAKAPAEERGATIKRQDDETVRASLDLRQKRLSRLFSAMIKPLMRQTDFERKTIKPEDLRYGGSENADTIETFHNSDQKNPQRMEAKLTSGWHRNDADPDTATQRIAAVQGKTGGAVYLVSVYKRGSEVRLLDPLAPGGEHVTLPDLLKRYRVMHSFLLDEPVVKFKERFSDYADFNNRFMTEALERDASAKEGYLREPVSEQEAIEASPWGMRIRGRKTDEFGNEADLHDPEAEEKIAAQRKSRKAEVATELSNADIKTSERIRLEQERQQLEQDPQLSEEYEGFSSNVKRGEGGSFMGPARSKADAALGISSSGRNSKAPLSESEGRSLYNFIKSELPKIESTEDVEAILMGVKHAKNPLVTSALAKFGRRVFQDYFDAARQRQQELYQQGDKITARLLEPKLTGVSLVREAARRLYSGMKSSRSPEEFSSKMSKVVNRTPEPGSPDEPASRGTELTMPIDRRPPTDVRGLPPGTAPGIPEATTTARAQEPMPPADQEWVKSIMQPMPEPTDYPAVAATRVSEVMAKAAAGTSGKIIQYPKASERVATPYEEDQQFSETRARIEEAGHNVVQNMRAWTSRSASKDDLTRTADGAETTSANGARQAAWGVRLKTQDERTLASVKAMISARAVRRSYRYSRDAFARIKELVADNPMVKLSQAMLKGDINQTKIITARLRADAGKNQPHTPEWSYITGLEHNLNNAKIDTQRLIKLGAGFSQEVRRGLERQLINEGLLTHQGSAYSVDDMAAGRIDGFKALVQKGIDEAESQSKSPDRAESRMGRARLESARKLMDELDYAKSNWGSRELREASIAASKELDSQFDYEKANGYEVKYDDGFIPGRYDAEFFNNDAVTFGSQRILGRRFAAAKTFQNYYEAIAAGPYIPVTLDASALVEHRVRQGLTKVNQKRWEESWKGMNDPHTGAPVAVGTKLVGKRAVPDVPTGVQGTRYEVVDKSDGTKMAVLYGYHRLYRQLTEPSAVDDFSLTRGALKVSQFLKHTVLMGDFFHFGRVGFYAAAINGVKDLQGGWMPGWAALEFREDQLAEAVAKGVIPRAEAAWAKGHIPFNDGKKGGSITRMELAQRMQKSGLNVGQIQDAIYRDLAGHMPLLGKLNVKWSRYLFDKWTRGLMTRSAINEFERIQKLSPGGDSNPILKTVSRDMNNFFGSIGRQGWIKSRTFQDLSRMVLLAPQWFEGLVKKDFAIPYKFVTGIHNGEAVKLIRGQESIGRGVVRGMLFMAALTQVINYINKGHPTWENEDKEHHFDADLGGGVYLSPLSVFNEILHDLNRYNETKPKFWDAIQQIGENKLSFFSRAALVLATDKNAQGEYETTTAGVIKAAASQFIPAPITFKGPATMAYHALQGKHPQPQDYKSALALIGLKADVGRSVMSRMDTAASQFVSQNHLRSETMQMTPTDAPGYQKLRHSIETGDVDGAEQLYQQLEQEKGERQIAKAMKLWEDRPLTGSRKNEVKWLHSMTEEDRQQYQQAILYKRNIYNQWVKFFISHRG